MTFLDKLDTNATKTARKERFIGPPLQTTLKDLSHDGGRLTVHFLILENLF